MAKLEKKLLPSLDSCERRTTLHIHTWDRVRPISLRIAPKPIACTFAGVRTLCAICTRAGHVALLKESPPCARTVWCTRRGTSISLLDRVKPSEEEQLSVSRVIPGFQRRLIETPPILRCKTKRRRARGGSEQKKLFRYSFCEREEVPVYLMWVNLQSSRFSG